MIEFESSKEFAQYFDSTILDPFALSSQVAKLCESAQVYNFASVCINPRWVPFASSRLYGSDIRVCTVVGFPLGAEMSRVKAIQAKEAIEAGADEIDMVADLTSIIENDQNYLRADIYSVLEECRVDEKNVKLKVIIESAALEENQIAMVCRICSELGVNFIKTSTGFHKAGGARVEDVRLIRESAPECKVKAAGGIRTLSDAMAMIEAGAIRIGTSSAESIVDEYKAIYESK